VIACALATWIIAERFSLSRPSLIDDWWNITVSPEQSLDFPQLVAPDEPRFRPAYTLWNYIQWHILGAPESLIWPNIANIGRILLLVAGLAAFTALALGAQRAGPGWGSLVLVLLPPLLVVTVPQFDVDLARFGPQEPVLVGGLTLGGSLLFLGCRELTREAATRRRGRIAFVLALGYLSWLLGVYQKEASVCVAVVVAFLVFGYRNSLRRRFASLDTRTRVSLAAIGAAALLPVAHVAIEVIVISREHSESVLGAGESLTSRARNVGTALEVMPTVLGTPVGSWLLVIVAVGIVIRFIQRKPDWTEVGLLAGALAFLAWSTQVGLYPSRYFLPFVALLAVAFSRLMNQLPPPVRWATIVAVVSSIELRSVVLETRLGWCILVAVACCIGYGFLWRRPEWTHAGLVVGPLAALMWSPQFGLYPSQQFQPVIVLVALGAGLLLIRRPALLQPLSIVVFTSLALLVAEPGRTAVESWTSSERSGISLVDAVSRLDASGCPVVIAGLDAERATALPVLVRMRQLPRSSCQTTEAFLVSDQLKVERVSQRICASRRDILGSWPHFGVVVQVTRCRSIAPDAKAFVTRTRMK
jgi:hypothetical protein